MAVPLFFWELPPYLPEEAGSGGGGGEPAPRGCLLPAVPRRRGGPPCLRTPAEPPPSRPGGRCPRRRCERGVFFPPAGRLGGGAGCRAPRAGGRRARLVASHETVAGERLGIAAGCPCPRPWQRQGEKRSAGSEPTPNAEIPTSSICFESLTTGKHSAPGEGVGGSSSGILQIPGLRSQLLSQSSREEEALCFASKRNATLVFLGTWSEHKENWCGSGALRLLRMRRVRLSGLPTCLFKGSAK